MPGHYLVVLAPAVDKVKMNLGTYLYLRSGLKIIDEDCVDYGHHHRHMMTYIYMEEIPRKSKEL